MRSLYLSKSIPNALLCLSFASCLLLIGCQSTPPLPEPTTLVTEELPEPVPSMQPYYQQIRPPAQRIDPAAYAAIQVQTKRFAILDSKRFFTQKITAVATDDQRPARFLIDLNGDARQHIQLTEQGPVMDAIEIPRFDRLTLFTTPQPIISPSLTPDQPTNFTTPVKVFDSNAPDKLISEGYSTTLTTYEADVTLELPSGTYDCIRLRIDYRGEFAPVRAWSTTYLYYARDLGLIASSTDEHAVIFGMIPIHTVRTMILSETTP